MRTNIVLCLLAVSAILFPMHVGAATSYVCTVDQAGPTGPTPAGGAKICVTHTAGNPAWTGSKAFKVPAERTKEFLSIAIAAIANNKKVRIFPDASMTNVRTILLIAE